MSRACRAVQGKLLEHLILSMKCLVSVLEDGWTKRQCGMWMETSIFVTGVQEESVFIFWWLLHFSFPC